MIMSALGGGMSMDVKWAGIYASFLRADDVKDMC